MCVCGALCPYTDGRYRGRQGLIKSCQRPVMDLVITPHSGSRARRDERRPRCVHVLFTSHQLVQQRLWLTCLWQHNLAVAMLYQLLFHLQTLATACPICRKIHKRSGQRPTRWSTAICILPTMDLPFPMYTGLLSHYMFIVIIYSSLRGGSGEYTERLHCTVNSAAARLMLMRISTEAHEVFHL